MAKAKDLPRWKRTLREHFGDVRIESVSDNMDGAGRIGRAGTSASRRSWTWAPLRREDVAVELYYGPLDDDGQLTDGEATAMDKTGNDGPARARYAVQMPCLRSGMTGYTVRVMPQHPGLADARDMGLDPLGVRKRMGTEEGTSRGRGRRTGTITRKSKTPPLFRGLGTFSARLRGCRFPSAGFAISSRKSGLFCICQPMPRLVSYVLAECRRRLAGTR